MRLASVRLHHVGVFEDTTVHFADDAADTRTPRRVTVLYGGDGIGKTTLLTALAVTRPGCALPPAPLPRTAGQIALEGPAFVVTEWLLGTDDPGRPHPLVVASPTAVFADEEADAASARRREQAMFDRRAQAEGGFVFVCFSGARWFSRTANMLSTPERTILRYDVRAPATFDDPTRADLTRETKQVLSYAGIARALAADRAAHAHLARFDLAVREVVDVMLAPFGFTYAGVSPASLEPEAIGAAGQVVAFDALPRPARHLVAFGALTLRALVAAYPRHEDPRRAEGVVAIDDVESQQDPALLRILVPLLRRALPNVQWILTTSSTQLAMACTPGEVIALRREGAKGIEVGEGVLH